MQMFKDVCQPKQTVKKYFQVLDVTVWEIEIL